MDGAQFAKMLSDKHLFELNRMEYKYSTVSVKEFAELLRQNFAQPLPLTDFSGNKLFYLPNLAQISTNGMKQLLSVPVSGQNFGLSAMTEEIYATFQIESIRSTRSSIRYILDGYAPRDEQEARIYGMKRGLEFIANRQNTITEENLHHLYQISTGDYAARAVILKDISPESEFRRDFLFFYCKGWFLFFCGDGYTLKNFGPIGRQLEGCSQHNMKVIEIANAVGYENQGKFAQVFAETYSVTPLEFRRLSK